MNEHHAVNIIRISEIKPHTNADKLEIIPIEGYQAVVAKGQFKPGQLAYYIPPDSVVPDRPEYAFLWNNATFTGEVPVSKRRITAKKLRGEWSEGLLMPITPGTIINCNNPQYPEGTDVSEQFGIIHYNPVEPGPTGTPKKKRVFPRSLRGWKHFLITEYNDFIRQIRGSLYEEAGDGNPGVPDYSIQALKKFPNELIPGELIKITEKIHGSNARYTFRKNKFGRGGKMYVGTHYTWRSADSTCDWGNALQHQPWIENWCRQYPGYTLYGEIAPTQSRYPYGTTKGQIKFFVFDVRTPEGEWLPSDRLQNGTIRMLNGVPDYPINLVPVLHTGEYDSEIVKTFVDGKSVVDPSHIREGIVVETLERVDRKKLKIVSNVFLEAEKR